MSPVLLMHAAFFLALVRFIWHLPNGFIGTLWALPIASRNLSLQTFITEAHSVDWKFLGLCAKVSLTGAALAGFVHQVWH